MENCLECSCTSDFDTSVKYQSFRQRITKFLASFVLEGSEDMSKVK